MAKRILVPLGKREGGQAVLPVVAPVARDGGATVRLLRVYPIPDLVVGPHGRIVAYADQQMDSLSREGETELRAIADTTLDGVSVETVVRFGDPVAEILTEAETFGADLVALTTTERSGLHRALIGGTADDVTRKAAVPTLILKEISP
jgi:nucleotide-binding universal stress UspA family protein